MLSSYRGSRVFILLCGISISCAFPAHGDDTKTGLNEAKHENQSVQKEANGPEVSFVGPALPASEKNQLMFFLLCKNFLADWGNATSNKLAPVSVQT